MKRRAAPGSRSQSSGRRPVPPEREPLSRPQTPRGGAPGPLPPLRRSGLRLQRSLPWLELAGIAAMLALGLWVRLEDIQDWRANREFSFLQGEPLLVNLDGYFYLAQARDLVEGTYSEVDPMRGVPESPSRRFPPPLLSWLIAVVVKATHLSINWVGCVIPAVLGLSLALPMYLLARSIGGPPMAMVTSLLALLAPFYVRRSAVGWLDTDCMNVTWTWLVAYCFLRFALDTTRRRYIPLAGGMAAFGLFLLWWDSTPMVVTALSLTPLAVALAFFYRPPRMEGLVTGSLLALAAAVVIWWQGPGHLIENLEAHWAYLTKAQTGDWPSMSRMVGEQARPTLNTLAATTAGAWPVFILSGAGLGLFLWNRRKEALLLAVPLLVAPLGFQAFRYAIFLVPAVALGAGYTVALAWRERARIGAWAAGPAAVGLSLLVTVPALKTDLTKTYQAVELPQFVAGMDVIRQRSPADAVAWAWWDHGYPMIYWADRATIGDGSFHSGRRSVLNGLPMACDDYRLAANLMYFFVQQGENGVQRLVDHLGDAKGALDLIQDVMRAGPEGGSGLLAEKGLHPETWLPFFYPPRTRPVYLFLDLYQAKTWTAWYHLATWDPVRQKGTEPDMRMFAGIEERDGRLVGPDVTVDLQKGGVIEAEDGRSFPMRRVVSYDGHKVSTRELGESGLTFEYMGPTKRGILISEDLYQSLFNKLFFLYTYNPRYFRPVVFAPAAYQVWEVFADPAVSPQGN